MIVTHKLLDCNEMIVANLLQKRHSEFESEKYLRQILEEGLKEQIEQVGLICAHTDEYYDAITFAAVKNEVLGNIKQTSPKKYRTLIF